MDLSQVRQRIDDIDQQMVDLFIARMEAAMAAAEAKAKSGAPVLDAGRERDILYRVAGQAGPELERYAKALYTTLFDVSRSYQRSRLQTSSPLRSAIEGALAREEVFPSRATVACQGVEGAYSQQACVRMFEFPNILYFDTFDAVFSAVEQGMCRYGILPIENSSAGSVSQVYDLMERHEFSIVRSIRQRIDHALLARQGADIGSIREVFSHPQAITQCSEFLNDHPNIQVTPVENTAVAAKRVAASGRTDVAAIASSACAKLYGLHSLSNAISNTDSNHTRFICIGKELEIFPSADRISLMVSLAHQPGSLYGLLSRFAAMGINLTKLESRPVTGKDFEFRFYLDIEASARDGDVTSLLCDIQAASDQFVFLGNYLEVR